MNRTRDLFLTTQHTNPSVRLEIYAKFAAKLKVFLILIKLTQSIISNIIIIKRKKNNVIYILNNTNNKNKQKEKLWKFTYILLLLLPFVFITFFHLNFLQYTTFFSCAPFILYTTTSEFTPHDPSHKISFEMKKKIKISLVFETKHPSNNKI
jgi:hypothetical protein